MVSMSIFPSSEESESIISFTQSSSRSEVIWRTAKFAAAAVCISLLRVAFFEITDSESFILGGSTTVLDGPVLSTLLVIFEDKYFWASGDRVLNDFEATSFKLNGFEIWLED